MIHKLYEFWQWAYVPFFALIVKGIMHLIDNTFKVEE